MLRGFGASEYSRSNEMLFSDGTDMPARSAVRKFGVAETLPVAAVINENVVRFDIYASGSAVSDPAAKVLLFY